MTTPEIRNAILTAAGDAADELNRLEGDVARQTVRAELAEADVARQGEVIGTLQAEVADLTKQLASSTQEPIVPTRFPASTLNAMLDGILTRLNGGTIEAWTGAPPSVIGDAPAGTKLTAYAIPNPAAAGPAAGGVGSIDCAPNLTATAVASGDVGFVRILNAASEVRYDATAGLTGSGAEVEMASLTFTNDSAAPAITSAQLRFGLTAPPTPPATTFRVGVDWNDNNASFPSYYTDWKVARCYNLGAAYDAIADWPNVEVIALSDKNQVSVAGLSTSANNLRNWLIGWYEGTGHASRDSILIDVVTMNEIDKHYQTGTLPANVITTMQLCYDVVHEELPGGGRRFPNVRLGVDMTVFNLQSKGTGPRLKPLAPYCDFFGSSGYPPGRSADPVVWTPYANYIPVMVNTCADWGVSNFVIWEVGSPIDHSYDDGSPNFGGTTDWTVRPNYFTGGGSWVGYLQDIKNRCDALGIAFDYAIYWNRQDNPDIPNPFKHDRGQAPNDLATRWHDFVMP